MSYQIFVLHFLLSTMISNYSPLLNLENCVRGLLFLLISNYTF